MLPVPTKKSKRVKHPPIEPPEIDIEERCFLFERGHEIAWHVQRAAQCSPLWAGTWREVIGNARQFLNDDLYRLLPGLTAVAETTATRQEIGKATIVLSAVVQYNKQINMELFAPVLTQDIAELQPSKLALCMAMRALRKKSEWGPPIATVLEAVKWATEIIPHTTELLDDLSEHIEKALESYRLYLTPFVVRGVTVGSYRWELKYLAADYLIDQKDVASFPDDIVDEARQMIEQYGLLAGDRPNMMLITGKQLVEREQTKLLTHDAPKDS